jgi:hypothetical protein
MNTVHGMYNIKLSNLSCFLQSTFYAGITIYNGLPPSLTILKNDKAKFKTALRKHLNTHSFYYVDEFFMCKDHL